MIRLGTNIESFGMFAIHFVFNFTKRFTNLISYLVEKNFSEGIAKETEIKVCARTPNSMITSTTFRDKSMNVRIPFQVTPESMKNQNKSRGEKFSFVLFVKHTKNNISDRMKETI